jgi:hypothetical protein
MPSGQKDRGVAPRDLATAADASGIHADIWLGYVAVSIPDRTFGGVVQFNMGKATPSGFT